MSILIVTLAVFSLLVLAPVVYGLGYIVGAANVQRARGVDARSAYRLGYESLMARIGLR